MLDILLIMSAVFVVYTYAGYPLVLKLLASKRQRPHFDPASLPEVTLVIAAFNEESCIHETLQSILASDYPAPFNVIVSSDASTDRTDEIVRSFPADRVQLLRQEKRSGQTEGMLRGAARAATPLLVFADASGVFQADTLRCLVRHFADPGVGAVSGFCTLQEKDSAVAKEGSLYARYDRTLRALESQTGGSWVGCQGGLYAIRKELYKIDFPLSIAGDAAMGYRVYERGFAHLYDPQAKVIERPPRNLENEYLRKVRNMVLQLRGVFVFRRLFNPLQHPMFFFQNVSHKLFRWLVPFFLPFLWIGSAFSRHPWAPHFFVLQTVFYGLALVGFILQKTPRTPRLFSIPAYFVTVNTAGLLAWLVLLRDYTIWTPPARDEAGS